MSKKTFDLFFAVGDPSRRSSLWRVWGTPKGDACLMCCEVNADFKLTLHPPNERHPRSRCHLSYRDEESLKSSQAGTHPNVVVDDLPREFAKAKSDGYGRFEDVWEPQEFVPGLAMPFRIGMPDSELRPLRPEVLAGRDVVWLPAPGTGHMVEVAFMIATKQVPPDAVPGAKSHGRRLLQRHAFGDDMHLLVLWRAHALSAEDQMWVVAYRPSILPTGDALRDSSTTHDYHRVVVDVRDDACASRAFIDTAVE
jgi:hypothetical protein